MKTREADLDEKKAVDEKQATDGHGWTQMGSGGGEDQRSGERERPRRRFGIRASEGSSVFRLLFPG
jgi:hypothetical protein